MKKYICYIVAFLSLSLMAGCHGIGVIVPHHVVYTSHTPRTYVYRPRIRHRHVHVPRRALRPRKRIIRRRYVHRQNVYNRTVIHRHYYNRSKKNRNRGKGKRKKR